MIGKNMVLAIVFLTILTIFCKFALFISPTITTKELFVWFVVFASTPFVIVWIIETIKEKNRFNEYFEKLEKGDKTK